MGGVTEENGKVVTMKEFCVLEVSEVSNKQVI